MRFEGRDWTPWRPPHFHTRAQCRACAARPLLRLQSDERLIALTRRGQHAAFEALCSRYQARLLSFCRHMLGSREDAEDVLQEVFAAAFNAVLADEREINVRPWLYRIARNRSLNHLRRASAVGVDSMDVHFADHGLSTGDRVIRRESFRELLVDVQRAARDAAHGALAARDRRALIRTDRRGDGDDRAVGEVAARARAHLARRGRRGAQAELRRGAARARRGGRGARGKPSAPARRHVRDCDRCRSFKKQLRENNHALAAMLPVGPLLIFKKLLVAKLGSAARPAARTWPAGAGATVGASTAATAGAAGGAGAAGAGGVFTVGAGALATKAVAGLAAAAIVSAGAVAANDVVRHPAHAHAPAYVAREVSEPVIVAERSQPVSIGEERVAFSAARPLGLRHRRHAAGSAKHRAAATTAPATLLASTAAPATTKPTAPPEATGTLLTQVTTATTELPASATSGPQTTPSPEGSTPATTTTPSQPATTPPAGAETPATTPAPPPPPEGTEPTPVTPKAEAPPAVAPPAAAPPAAQAQTNPSPTSGAQAPAPASGSAADAPNVREITRTRTTSTGARAPRLSRLRSAR